MTPPAPQHTRDRHRAKRLALSDPEEALRLARDIEDHWFRCQALAFVGYRCESAAMRATAITESFQAGWEIGPPSRVVVASAWPLKVLCKKDGSEDLTDEVARLLGISDTERSPVRRADALDFMLGALITAPRELFWQAYERFEQACAAPLHGAKRNVRGETLLVQWLPVLHCFDSARAEAALVAIHGPVLAARARDTLVQNPDVNPEAWIRHPNLD
ncbi:MAG: hypothetical protein ABIU54_01415 [Candidatus Eisenbacteria bacterium]